jgi:hypothetical protein
MSGLRSRLGWGLWGLTCAVPALAAAQEPAARAEPAPPSEPVLDPYLDEEPIEVTVREPARAEGSTVLTRAEVRAIPGAFGDPFRVIESVPSVVPLASGVPYFYVRGAPPGDVGYFLDGIRVPLLFHLGLGPSVVHPALIDRVELAPGANPELGRYAGGAVLGTLTAPREDLRVEGNLRLVDTGAFLEVPFDEGRGSAFAAGRVAYTALLFSLVNSSAVLNYWDYAGRVSYEVAKGQTVSLFGFGAYDYLAEKREDGPDERLFDTMFHRIDLGYDVDINPRTRVEQDVILGFDQTHLGTDQKVVDRALTLRSTLRHVVDDDVELRAGFDLTVDDYFVDLEEEEGSGFASFFRSREDLAAGAFLLMPLQLPGGLSLLPSLRADLYVSEGKNAFGFDPNLSARFALLPQLALLTSHGLASQPPSFIVAGPGFRPGLDEGGLQRAFSSSVGVEAKPSEDWLLKAAVYRTAFFDINDALGTSALAGEGFPGGFEDFNPRFDGTSLGLELSAKRRFSKTIGAILSYSLGRSERRDARGQRFPSGFDRTHVASAALSFDFGAGYKGGIRQLLYTGTPLLDVSGSAPRVKERLPPFYRMDFRLEKRFTIGKTGFVTMVLEALNSFLADEVLGESCDEQGRCEQTTLGPIAIPSFGVEGGY